MEHPLIKFDSKNSDHMKLADQLPFSYEAATPFLDFAAFILTRNGDQDLVVQDEEYPNEFPYLFLPKKKSNWEEALIVWASNDDLRALEKEVLITKKIDLGPEFYYKTEDLINMPGGKWSKFRSRVRQFERNYSHTLTDDPKKADVDDLMDRWLKTQKVKTVSFQIGIDFFHFCYTHRKKYDIKVLGVMVDNKLAGITMGWQMNATQWVGFHMKADYQYKGLSRFMHHHRAHLFAETEECTIGESAQDPGILAFKEEMNPYKKIQRTYVITGLKQS